MRFLQSPFLSSIVSLIVTRLNKLIAFLELRLKLISFTCSGLTTYIFISQLFNSSNWLCTEADKKELLDWMSLKSNTLAWSSTWSSFRSLHHRYLYVLAGNKNQAILEHSLLEMSIFHWFLVYFPLLMCSK